MKTRIGFQWIIMLGLSLKDKQEASTLKMRPLARVIIGQEMGVIVTGSSHLGLMKDQVPPMRFIIISHRQNIKLIRKMRVGREARIGGSGQWWMGWKNGNSSPSTCRPQMSPQPPQPLRRPPPLLPLRPPTIIFSRVMAGILNTFSRSFHSGFHLMGKSHFSDFTDSKVFSLINEQWPLARASRLPCPFCYPIIRDRQLMNYLLAIRISLHYIVFHKSLYKTRCISHKARVASYFPRLNDPQHFSFMFASVFQK